MTLVAAGTLVVLSLLHATSASTHVQRADTSPGGVPVAVVIEFGPRSGVHPPTVVKCLKVRQGSSGADVLADVATAERLPAPSYATNGLLCTIDGYPHGGCGASSSASYAYWSYWRGGTAWTYSLVGPSEETVAAGDVEGWRWQPGGAGSSTDPPPGAPSRYAAACALDAVVPSGLPGEAEEGTPLVAIVVAAVAVAALVIAAVRWRRSTR